MLPCWHALVTKYSQSKSPLQPSCSSPMLYIFLNLPILTNNRAKLSELILLNLCRRLHMPWALMNSTFIPLIFFHEFGYFYGKVCLRCIPLLIFSNLAVHIMVSTISWIFELTIDIYLLETNNTIH